MDLEYTEDDVDLSLSEDEQINTLQKKIASLKNDIAVCKKEKEEYLLGWQRCQADSINARKDDEKKLQEHIQFATQDIIEELIAIKTTFGHAFKSIGEENSYVRGFRNISTQLDVLLSRHGVEEIEAVGNQFNILLHEAIENVLVQEKEKDHLVIEEIEKGYMMHGKVIKPSKVKVGEYKSSD